MDYTVLNRIGVNQLSYWASLSTTKLPGVRQVKQPVGHIQLVKLVRN